MEGRGGRGESGEGEGRVSAGIHQPIPFAPATCPSPLQRQFNNSKQAHVYNKHAQLDARLRSHEAVQRDLAVRVQRGNVAGMLTTHWAKELQVSGPSRTPQSTPSLGWKGDGDRGGQRKDTAAPSTVPALSLFLFRPPALLPHSRRP